MTLLRGFDVSHWQGSINWEQFARVHGLSFAFCKASQAENFIDPKFVENWKGMDRAGLIRGAYHFAKPDANPEDDAQVFVRTVKAAGPMHLTDLMVLDLEVSDLNKAATNHWARGWALEVRRLLPGYAPVLYAGAGYMSTDTGRGLRDVFGAWWYPRWPGLTTWPADFGHCHPPSPNVWGTGPDFWQWTDAYPGGQKLDANVYRGTQAQLRSINPAARPSPPVPTQPKPPVPPGPPNPPVPVPTSVRVLHRMLRLGSTGGDVKAMQDVVGMNVADQDGAFGTQTEWHVKDWQRDKHIAVDGVFGPQSCKAAGWRWDG